MTGLLVDARQLDLDAWAHGRGDCDPAQVLTLGTGRLCLLDGVNKCLDVLLQSIFRERHLANTSMNDTGLFDAELNSATLGVVNCGLDVRSYRTDLRVRHQAARAENLTETTDERHHVRCSNDCIEVDLAALDFLDEFFCTNDVCTSCLGFFSLVTTCEHGNADSLARTVRQNAHAADHLVSVTRVNTQIHGDFDGFIEFRLGVVFENFNSSFNAVEGIAVNVTAVLTMRQVDMALSVVRNGIISIFAGRIADTGRDPRFTISYAKKYRPYSDVQILWASAREVLNVSQADEAGADIITLTPDLIAKLSLHGKDLTEYSLATVKMFYGDGKEIEL